MKESDKHLFKIYSRHYQSMGKDRLPDDIEKVKRDRLPSWISNVPLSARILDVGCAQGHLLAGLHRVGYSNLAGFDLSEAMVEDARKILPNTVRLEISDVRDFLKHTPSSSYDVVFCHDVLEHLPRQNTIEILCKFKEILSDNGYLSIRVPNMSSLFSSYCANIDFTHITNFTEYSLLQVLEAAGFNPASIRFPIQAPILFWDWGYSIHSFFRVLNRIRWHLNNGLHRVLYLLWDMHPQPKIFDCNLVALVKKRN